MKRNDILDKIFNAISVITSEYVISTSIYLLSLFVLNIAKSLNWINLLYWLVMFNFLFEKFLLKNNRAGRETSKKISIYMIRTCFIAVNILAFGINIFNIP